jgi:hypothetical protein
MEESKPAREARGGDFQIGLALDHVKELGGMGNAKTKHVRLEHGLCIQQGAEYKTTHMDFSPMMSGDYAPTTRY